MTETTTSSGLVPLITAAQIRPSTITYVQIAPNTITGSNIANNTITAYNISSNTITTNEIATQTILANNIAAGTITGNEIDANTISGSHIIAGTIQAVNIAAGTITSNEISANTITGDNINALDLTGKTITADTGMIGGWALGATELVGPAGAVIRSGQTDFNVGTGFWLGNVADTPKFSFGVANGDRMYWDSSNLYFTGKMAATSVINTYTYTTSALPIPPTAVGFNSPAGNE